MALIVDFQIKIEHRDEFIRMCREHAAATLEEEEGCVQFDVFTNDDDDPEKVASGELESVNIILFEAYRDPEAMAIHSKTWRVPALRERYEHMVVGKTTKRVTVHDAPLD